ncbi:hypothetical protein ACOMHN_017149 [Nucella lapillus]
MQCSQVTRNSSHFKKITTPCLPIQPFHSPADPAEDGAINNDQLQPRTADVPPPDLLMSRNSLSHTLLSGPRLHHE